MVIHLSSLPLKYLHTDTVILTCSPLTDRNIQLPVTPPRHTLNNMHLDIRARHVSQRPGQE